MPRSCVRVGDTGIGIPARDAARIFDMFTQVDSTLERSQGGLGIGLTLVRALVEMHGGSVEAASAARARAASSSSGCRRRAARALQRRPSEPRARLPQRRCACWSSTTTSMPRRASRVLLRLMGHDVELAGDGRAALELARVVRARPRAAGHRPARHERLRGRRRTCGSSRGCAARRSSPSPAGARTRTGSARGETGFDHHLTKPVEPRLLEKILASVRSRRAQTLHALAADENPQSRQRRGHRRRSRRRQRRRAPQVPACARRAAGVGARARSRSGWRRSRHFASASSRCTKRSQRTLTSEVGKPIRQSRNELNGLLGRLDFFLEEAPRTLRNETVLADVDAQARGAHLARAARRRSRTSRRGTIRTSSVRTSSCPRWSPGMPCSTSPPSTRR